MSLTEIEKEALALTDKERAMLAVALLETLAPDDELSDEEVLQRDAELESGAGQEISREEFVRRVLDSNPVSVHDDGRVPRESGPFPASNGSCNR